MLINSVKCGTARIKLGTFLLPCSSLQTTSSRLKGNQRRPILAGKTTESGSDKATSHRESVAKVISAAARAKWEVKNIELQRLSGIIPSTAIYFAENFERRKWPFSDAVEMLRECAVPEIYDCLENPLVAKIDLNMRTKKLTKFISKYEVEVLLPHNLSFLPKRRIIALCTDPAQIEQCLAVGASAAGGNELITRLEQGGFHWDEYDDVVAHPDLIDSINRLKKILRNRFPTVKNKRLDSNVPDLVSTYQNAVILESNSIEGIPELAQINAVLGQLSWSTEHLMENLLAYLQVLNDNKSYRIHGELLTDISLESLPCDEKFYLNPIPLLAAIVQSTPIKHSDDTLPHEDLEEIEANSISP